MNAGTVVAIVGLVISNIVTLVLWLHSNHLRRKNVLREEAQRLRNAIYDTSKGATYPERMRDFILSMKSCYELPVPVSQQHFVNQLKGGKSCLRRMQETMTFLELSAGRLKARYRLTKALVLHCEESKRILSSFETLFQEMPGSYQPKPDGSAHSAAQAHALEKFFINQDATLSELKESVYRYEESLEKLCDRIDKVIQNS